jgi:hypothetical protein
MSSLAAARLVEGIGPGTVAPAPQQDQHATVARAVDVSPFDVAMFTQTEAKGVEEVPIRRIRFRQKAIRHTLSAG